MLPITIAERERLYLELLRPATPTEIASVISLWDGYSGMPGLLHSGKYVFRDGVYYEVRGNIRISDRQLKKAVNNVAQEVSSQMRKKTQQLITGIITLLAWYYFMRSAMKVLYRAIWLLAIGGLLFEDDVERALLYAFIVSQFTFLDNFVLRLQSGEITSASRIMQYAGMYGSHANVMYQNTKLRLGTRYGLTEGRRVLAPNENHCRDRQENGIVVGRRGCVELAALGWLPIEEVTPLGDAICHGNCLCDIEVR